MNFTEMMWNCLSSACLFLMFCISYVKNQNCNVFYFSPRKGSESVEDFNLKSGIIVRKYSFFMQYFPDRQILFTGMTSSIKQIKFNDEKSTICWFLLRQTSRYFWHHYTGKNSTTGDKWQEGLTSHRKIRRKKSTTSPKNVHLINTWTLITPE